MKFNRIVLKNFYFYLFFRSNAGKCWHCNHCNILELWGWLNSSHRCLSTLSLLNTARTNMEVVSRFSDREKTQTHPLKYFLKTIFDLLGASWTRLVNQKRNPSPCSFLGWTVSLAHYFRRKKNLLQGMFKYSSKAKCKIEFHMRGVIKIWKVPWNSSMQRTIHPFWLLRKHSAHHLFPEGRENRLLTKLQGWPKNTSAFTRASFSVVSIRHPCLRCKIAVSVSPQHFHFGFAHHFWTIKLRY